jgi:uncharacterized protein
MNAFRLLYLAFGWFCVGLGIIGIIFPFLPTTPFLLLAVWAFGRSSPELAAKLRNHPQVGRYIRDWQDHGVIPSQAKLVAILMMSVMATYFVVWSGLPLWAVAATVSILVGVGLFILSRPSEPPVR